MTTDLTTVPNNGTAIEREGFNNRELATQAETAANAMAAQARATVESRFVLAIRRPRDWDTVRVALLKACARPGFAAVARYRKPIGKGVEGPSIRFAEEAMRAMGNLLPETMVIYDDDTKRIVRVMVTDLENNLTLSNDVVVSKTVERSSVKADQRVIGQRTNSRGGKTFVVEATDDDLLNKQNALISKALRTHALRLLPGDIMDECMEAVIATTHRKDAEDPDAARKKLADAFAKLNVSPAALKEYLGHDLATCAPAGLADLRALWAAINDGEGTWHQALEARQSERTGGEPATAVEGKGTSGLRAKVQRAAEAGREPGAE